MERLIEQDPERYGMRHLQIMQRRVSGYRLAQIERELQETLEPRHAQTNPWRELRTLCYQASNEMGNFLLMQSAGPVFAVA